MKTRKFMILTFATALSMIFLAKSTDAHHSGSHAVILHVNDKWEQCAIVLDPSLTQSDFQEFAKDASSIFYFRPMGEVKPLGRLKFNIALEVARTGEVKDYKPSWNNTFSHPDSTHWLKTPLTDDHHLAFPMLRVSIGITDQIDGGLYITNNSSSNYGFMGIGLKYTVINHAEKGYAVATRFSYATLLGVEDMNYNLGSVDLLVSKDIGLFTPYAGVAGVLSSANETTSKVDLERVNTVVVQGVVGTQFQYKLIRIAAEVDVARMNMYSLKIGTAF